MFSHYSFNECVVVVVHEVSHEVHAESHVHWEEFCFAECRHEFVRHSPPFHCFSAIDEVRNEETFVVKFVTDFETVTSFSEVTFERVIAPCEILSHVDPFCLCFGSDKIIAEKQNCTSPVQKQF